MTAPHDEHEARLAELLSDAVSDVEPADALESIRDRTKVGPGGLRRPWLVAVGGAVVATAAVITAIALAGGGLPGTTAGDGPGPAGNSESPRPMPSAPTDRSPSSDEVPTSSADAPSPRSVVVPVYFVGDTPGGPRLYRERQRAETVDELTAALEIALSGLAADPDYRSSWPRGTQVDEASYDGEVITIGLGSESDLHDRPGGMAEDEAAMAVQQLVHTAQAALQKGRPGVQFLLDGAPTDRVLGVPASEPLVNGPVLQTLALVSLTFPEEAQTVTGAALEVSGVANSYEANVVVRLEESESGQVLVEQPFTAEGWMGERLFPFSGSLDLADVPAGTYLLTASTDDPSGGAEGAGPHVDTRTIIVE